MHTPKTPAALRASVVHQITLAARHATRICGDKLDQAGQIDQAQWAVLAAVEANGPISCSALARSAGMDKVKASRAIGTLTLRGMLKVTEDRLDARRRIVTLTARGKRTHELAAAAEQEATAALVALLGQHAQSVLTGLSQMNNRAEQTTPAEAEPAAEERKAA